MKTRLVSLFLALLLLSSCRLLGMPYVETVNWIEFKDPNCREEPCKVIQKVRYVEWKGQSWEGVAVAGMDRYATKIETEVISDPVAGKTWIKQAWADYELIAKDGYGGDGFLIAAFRGSVGQIARGAFEAYGRINQAVSTVSQINYDGSRAVSLSNSFASAEAEAAAFAKQNFEFHQITNMGMPMGSGD